MKKSETLIPVTRTYMPELDSYMGIVSRVWETCHLTNRGPLVQQLEGELLEKLKVSHVVSFANGHLALDCVMRVLGLGSGEVITTPYTFVSTTNAIEMNGMKPVFCDVKDSDYTMDEDKIEALITPETKAIMPVHVYGFPCNHARIQEIADKHGLKVIYDAAHVFGVEVDGKGIGTLGDASMFSLHATKVFNCVEGGLITFRSEDLHAKLCSAQNFGLIGQDEVEQASLNAKMSEFHAAMGLANLRILDEQVIKRKELVEHYRSRLAEVDEIEVRGWDRQGVKYNYAYFPVCVKKDAPVSRDELAARLLSDYNIQVRKYFYPLTCDFRQYREKYGEADTPIARDFASRVMTLPLYVSLTHEQVDYICDAIREIFAK